MNMPRNCVEECQTQSWSWWWWHWRRRWFQNITLFAGCKSQLSLHEWSRQLHYARIL